MDKVTTVSTNHHLFEEKGEPDWYRTEVLQLTSLTLYHQAKPAHNCGRWVGRGLCRKAAGVNVGGETPGVSVHESSNLVV